MKQRLTMMEQQLFMFNLINTIIKKDCYVKPYLKKFRVMDVWHNPQTNIFAWQFRFLLKNKIIVKSGDVWMAAVEVNPFNSSSDIILKEKTTIT